MAEKHPHLIEPEELAANLEDGYLIIDLCSEQQYLSGHIPGAVHVSPQELVSGEPPAPGRLPSKEQLEALFTRIGLTPAQPVVVYDDEGGGWAGRMAWTLDVIGHQNWRYLNGGLTAWMAANHPLEAMERTPIPRVCQVHFQPQWSIDAEGILARLKEPGFAIWDARSLAEFLGERILAQKGGHIPGAVHCEWTSLMDANRQLRIRKDALHYLESLGLTTDKFIATHCQTHHRSGFTYMVARILGFPKICAYPGSWSDWGNRRDTLVETGSENH